MATVKLKPGFGQLRNRTDVVLDDRVVIGQMNMNRGSGWTGGPHYIFIPNAEGEAFGAKNIASGSRVREILKHISEAIGG